MATKVWARARRQLGIVPNGKDEEPNAIPDLDAALQRRKEFRSRPGVVERVSPFIPAIQWLADYDYKRLLRADILAGLTTAALLVPQGLAYAELAGGQQQQQHVGVDDGADVPQAFSLSAVCTLR